MLNNLRFSGYLGLSLTGFFQSAHFGKHMSADVASSRKAVTARYKTTKTRWPHAPYDVRPLPHSRARAVWVYMKDAMNSCLGSASEADEEAAIPRLYNQSLNILNPKP